ncbi:amidohydrolase family protein [Chloroflexota bacterium]
MIIDFHTHVFPSRIKENRRRYADNDPSFALLYSNEKAKLATAEELIASMDRDGIDISVIVNYGWTTHELCVETNDYILESVARYPRRLVGFGAVQPLSLKAALDEIERCAKGGIRGIGELRPDIQLLDFEHKDVMQPFVDVLQKHRLMLMIHASEPVGHVYPGKGTFTPDMIYPFITNFPDLTIVCAHWGGGLPFYALMPEVKQELKNVYFDTAASPFLYSPGIYRQVSQLIGADKILFGTDYPLIPPSRYLKEIDTADLNDEEKNLILTGNARKLLCI